MQTLLRDLVFLLLWVPSSQTHDQPLQDGASKGSGSSISHTSNTTSTKSRTASTLSGSATCPSRTVNYITHTLAQQCLRTDRASISSAKTSDANSISYNDRGISGSPTSAISTILSVSSTAVAVVTTERTTKPTESTTETNSIEKLDGSSVSVSSVATSPSSSPDQPSESESDSPLDNANFLSFEEWKRQNLAKAGQSPDNVGRPQPVGAGRQRPGIENALDGFGDENEISLDFTGFGQGASPPGSADRRSIPTMSSELSNVDQPSPASLESRSKDAGKTCKERTNYASFDCAASVLKSNPECKSASSVLVENKDTYTLNICSAKNKYFIVELCDDILIDTVVLANFEFFSSSFRHFRVSVSDRYPVKEEKWRELGTYMARNTREIQAFLVENPLIWARYLRVEFLTHYGSEYYCPVSLLRVHGTTMIQEYLHHEENSRDDHAEDGSSLVGEVMPAPPVPSNAPEPVSSQASSTIPGDKEEHNAITSPDLIGKTSTVDDNDERMVQVDLSRDIAGSTTDVATMTREEKQGNNGSNLRRSDFSQDGPSHSSNASSNVKTATESKLDTPVPIIPPDSPRAVSEVTNAASPKTDDPKSSNSQASPHPMQQSLSPSNVTTDTSADGKSGTPTNGTIAVPMASQPVSSHIAVSSSTSRSGPATSTGSQPAQPSTQESFFKSVHKRLQQLESNSTLSLQYIEEQSRILRDAFSKVEKRQLSATTTFLSNLNQTVMNDLHGFRQAYDQLWQSTVIELEGQREHFHKEMLAVSTRLSLVADELVWQKRMGIIQSTLVLMCLAFVLFGRSGSGSLEFPIMQQMMNRSTAALRGGWESPPNSPSPASRSPARLFRPRLWRSNTEQSHLTDSEPSRPQSVDGPDLLVDPPTPSTPDTRSDVEEQEDIIQPAAERKADQSTSSPQPKKRRRRRQSLSSRSGKAKSPLGYS